MVDGGIGISAVGSKFIERFKFTARHDVIYDKEADKSVRLAERFDKFDKEEMDQFEFEAYTMLHSKSLQDLRGYKSAQEEYKMQEWYRQPVLKYRSRGKVREGKRKVQSSIAREGQHVDQLATYSRSASSSSSMISGWHGSECSIRATGGSPPSSSMKDICEDERKDRVSSSVSNRLSGVETEAEMGKTMGTMEAAGVQAKQNHSGDGDGRSLSEDVQGLKKRRVCDRCWLRKLGCNGGRPCSECTAISHIVHCRYLAESLMKRELIV